MQTNTRSDKTNTLASHPDYNRWVEDWKTLNDVVDGGQSTVKCMEARYLPPTSGQIVTWNKAMPGIAVEDLGCGQYVLSCSSGASCLGRGAYAYHLYKFRAIFYDYPAETVRQIVGRLTSNPAEIKLPGKLEAMTERATREGVSMHKLVEIIFGEQAKYSRCGVLADFPATETTNPPYLCVYGALRIKNWHVEKDPSTGLDKLQFVILDESDYFPVGLSWEYRYIIRVCALDQDGNYFTETHDVLDWIDKNGEVRGGGIPRQASEEMLKPSETAVYPTFNGKMSNEIPFVFINATNNFADPELPILNTVAEKSLAIYRGEADYRQALFMQGQATPTFSGMTSEEASKLLLGASGGVASNNPEFRASFMEVSGAGLHEMREAQDNLHRLAVTEGSKLINAGAGESGEALKERTDSQTISLNTLASTCESGLRNLIRIISEWGGIAADSEITLNREFTSGSATPDGLVKLIQAWQMGAPITKQDIHEWAREGGLSETSWEEVQEELDLGGRQGTI